MNNFLYFSTAFFLVACGDKPIEAETDGTTEQEKDASSQYNDPVPEPEEDPLEAVAIGFELIGVWNEQNASLDSWMTPDADGNLVEQNPYVVINITNQGYIKRGALSSLKAQKRGGKGKSGITTRDQDSVIQTLSVNTHTSVLFFSTEGLVYKVKAWKIPEGSSTSKGKSFDSSTYLC